MNEQEKEEFAKMLASLFQGASEFAQKTHNFIDSVRSIYEGVLEKPQAAYSVSKEKPGQADKCPVCGAPGRIVGNVTKSFERDEPCVEEWPSYEEILEAADKDARSGSDVADGTYSREDYISICSCAFRRGVRWLRDHTDASRAVHRLAQNDEVRAEIEKEFARTIQRCVDNANEHAAQNKVLRDALGDIEMAPRVLHPDNLAEKMQALAREALKKAGDVG